MRVAPRLRWDAEAFFSRWAAPLPRPYEVAAANAELSALVRLAAKLPEMSERTILHADMDAFYAAVEQRDDPSLRGKPVIVGGLGKRGVVSTASYEARRFGVHSAMPGAIAHRLCPDGIFVRPRMDVYVRVSQEIREIFSRFTPEIEPLSLDEAFLDVTGSRLLFGDGAAIAREIRRLVELRTQLTVSIGVASSKYVAKVASDLDKPDGLTLVPRGGERAFLRELPIKRLWGAGKVAQSKFERFGLRTIGDVQDFGERSLVAAFGEQAGRHYWRLAHGDDERPVVRGRAAKSISHECTFGDDLVGREHAHAVLLELCEGVGARLRAQRLFAQTLRLKLRFPPFETKTRQLAIDPASAADRVLHELAKQLYDAAVPEDERPIRLLGVAADKLIPQDRVRQGSLFVRRESREERVLDAFDTIRERFGKGSIAHGGIHLRRKPSGPEGHDGSGNEHEETSSGQEP